MELMDTPSQPRRECRLMAKGLNCAGQHKASQFDSPLEDRESRHQRTQDKAIQT